VPALLISVSVTAAENCSETSDPTPQPGDSLITRSAIDSSWPKSMAFDPQALIIRTRGPSTAYLTREAAQTIVRRGIQHLVIDLPSIDREHDAGRLTAHRVFFGLPPSAISLEHVTRPQATVTELASIPDELADGPYLLELQVPAWRGDAVPSRPLLYAPREA
jgi:kynurenine formamidase